MNIRPLPLQGWEVRAILAGSMARLVTPVVPQPFDKEGKRIWESPADKRLRLELLPLEFEQYAPARIIGQCPWGQPGDLLWVQEDWTEYEIDDIQGCRFYYKATETERNINGLSWESSLEMDRCHSRLTLEISAVQVVRLSKVRMTDFLKCGHWRKLWEEGVWRGDARGAFYSVFDRQHKAHGISTEDDPLLWMALFEAIEMNVDGFLELQGKAA